MTRDTSNETRNETTGPTGDGLRPHVDVDVVVVGAGLAGLAAAASAGRAGASTRVVEARTEPGGRARTATTAGFHLNQGPHALYRSGTGAAALRELGVKPEGANAPLSGARLELGDRLLRMPPTATLPDLVGTLRRLGSDASDSRWARTSADDWIGERCPDPVARRVLAALVRLSTYTGDTATMSADAAIAQLHAARRGVAYLHGGWGELVAQLRGVATAAGARLEPATKLTAAVPLGDHWVVHLADGRSVTTAAVVIAAGAPSAASRLLPGSRALQEAAAIARPVHAACLDLGLERLPVPRRTFVLGIDRPTYASVHSRVARLSDEGGAVLHVMIYEPDDAVDRADLEAVADRIQPGWRDVVVAEQIGLRRVVASDRPPPRHRARSAVGRRARHRWGVRRRRLGRARRPARRGEFGQRARRRSRRGGPRIPRRPPVRHDRADTMTGDRAPDEAAPGAPASDAPASDGPRPDDAIGRFTPHRDRLFGLAYRMTGSVADADDCVQEAFVRWHRADRSVVRNDEAYLVRVVARLAVDRHRSVARRREHYVGPWLPEPLLAPAGGSHCRPRRRRRARRHALVRVPGVARPPQRSGTRRVPPARRVRSRVRRDRRHARAATRRMPATREQGAPQAPRPRRRRGTRAVVPGGAGHPGGGDDVGARRRIAHR